MDNERAKEIAKSRSNHPSRAYHFKKWEAELQTADTDTVDSSDK